MKLAGKPLPRVTRDRSIHGRLISANAAYHRSLATNVRLRDDIAAARSRSAVLTEANVDLRMRVAWLEARLLEHFEASRP